MSSGRHTKSARVRFDDGATRRDLMEMYGVSESTIRRVLRR
ncbi:hypothetical protein HJG43_07775 [Kineosporiaceae bacterium SCSIO 59966]|nr:hypothetical protein HJG43_07775 [Kineosporiaceae bacterium SCSIO 59966]